MHFSIKNKTFQHIIKAYSNIINSNASLPIITGLKMVLSHNKISFYGTDGYQSLKKEVSDATQFKVSENFEVVIKYKLLSEIASKITDEDIKFDLIESNILKIATASAEYEVNLFVDDVFPDLDFTFKQDSVFQVNAKNFKSAISTIAVCAADFPQKPIFGGVNFRSSENKLQLTATDTSRVGIASLEIAVNEKLNDFDETISLQSAKSISKIVPQDTIINFSIDKRRIIVSWNDSIYRSKVLNDQFPSVGKISSFSYSTKVDVSSNDIINVLEKVMALKGLGQTMTLLLKLRNDTLTITGREQAIGNAKATLSNIKCVGECNLDISLNSKYIYEAIRIMQGPNIKIEMEGPTKPVKITDATNSQGVIYVLPLRW